MNQGRQLRTFLFGDIEGSTRRWEADPDGMGEVVAGHDGIVNSAVEGHGGKVFKHTGDGFCAVFEDPLSAIGAAVEAQKGLVDLKLPVRMGIQTGPAEEREGDWFGGVLSATARLMDAGSGGQVLVGESTEVMVRSQFPEGVSLLDLGRHRFRDLGEAQEVFQVAHADLVSEFPPIRSLDFFPNNLPVQMTTFIGREAEVASIRELLGSNRLVTLTGVGGVGKTRLSLVVAATEADRFPGGIWFIELAALADGELIATEMMSALQLTGDHRQPEDVVIARLSEKPALLVFDNCEHLIDYAAKLIETLLVSSPETVAIATSREALGVSGEAAYTVPSLGVEGGSSEAVELFVNRARLVDSAFVVDESHRDAIEQICERLDGIPLAIELATARLLVMTPQLIAERLDDRFRLLTGGSRTALPRQRTLAAAMDWSYDLLGEREQTLLRRLAVFSGGFSLPAVEAVCTDEAIGPYDVLDLLQRLAATSLVTHHADDRYSMLETVRQYAVDKLAETGEMAVWRDRHLDHFKQVASGINAGLLAEGSDQLLRNLIADQDNLRLATTWALEKGEPDTAGRIVVDCQRMWQSLRLWPEAVSWGERLMELVDDPQLKGWLAMVHGLYLANLNRWTEGIEYSDLAFSLIDDPGGTDLDRAMWKVQEGNHLRAKRQLRQGYVKALEAFDFAQAHVPEYQPALWSVLISGSLVYPNVDHRYEEVTDLVRDQIDSTDNPQKTIESIPWVLSPLIDIGRASEVPELISRFDEAVRQFYGPEALPRERAIRGIEYNQARLALLDRDYERVVECLDRVDRFGESQAQWLQMHGTFLVLASLDRDDRLSARQSLARYLARAEVGQGPWRFLMWTAALLAEADGETEIAARILGSTDEDSAQTGQSLIPGVREFDPELRNRMEAELPDVQEHLAAGAALTLEELVALIDQVTTGRYE